MLFHIFSEKQSKQILFTIKYKVVLTYASNSNGRRSVTKIQKMTGILDQNVRQLPT